MTRDEVLERILDPNGAPGDPVERKALDAWLEHDAELREMFEEQQQLFSVMDSWESAEPSVGFDRGVYDKIEAYESSRNWFERWFGGLRPAMAGAAAMLVVGAVTFLVERDQPRPDLETAIAVTAEISAEDEQYLREIDLALDDIEMLADFDAIALDEASEGRS